MSVGSGRSALGRALAHPAVGLCELTEVKGRSSRAPGDPTDRPPRENFPEPAAQRLPAQGPPKMCMLRVLRAGARGLLAADL